MTWSCHEVAAAAPRGICSLLPRTEAGAPWAAEVHGRWPRTSTPSIAHHLDTYTFNCQPQLPPSTSHPACLVPPPSLQGQSINLRPVVSMACEEERRTHCSQVGSLQPHAAPLWLMLAECRPIRRRQSAQTVAALNGCWGCARAERACRRWRRWCGRTPAQAHPNPTLSYPLAHTHTPLLPHSRSRCGLAGRACSTACCHPRPAAWTSAPPAWRRSTRCSSAGCWTGAQARPAWLCGACRCCRPFRACCRPACSVFAAPPQPSTYTHAVAVPAQRGADSRLLHMPPARRPAAPRPAWQLFTPGARRLLSAQGPLPLLPVPSGSSSPLKIRPPHRL